MNERHVTLPTIALIAGTRVALGFGLALLLASRLTPEQRRAAGWALFTFGALSTIPLATEVLAVRRHSDDALRVRRNPVSSYVTTSCGDDD
jgi:hypothetical protein